MNYIFSLSTLLDYVQLQNYTEHLLASVLFRHQYESSLLTVPFGRRNNDHWALLVRRTCRTPSEHQRLIWTPETRIGVITSSSRETHRPER